MKKEPVYDNVNEFNRAAPKVYSGLDTGRQFSLKR